MRRLSIVLIVAEKNHFSVHRRKKVYCFQCNKHGHIAANCSQRTKTEKNKSCNTIQSKIEDSPKVIKVINVRDFIKLLINNIEATALFYSNSDLNFMRAGFYAKMGASKLISQIKFRRCCSRKFTLRLTHIKVCIDGKYFEVDFHVVPDALLNDNMIIGTF